MKTPSQIHQEIECLRKEKARAPHRIISGTDSDFGINLQIIVLRNGIEAAQVHWDELTDFERSLVVEAADWKNDMRHTRLSLLWGMRFNEPVNQKPVTQS